MASSFIVNNPDILGNSAPFEDYFIGMSESDRLLGDFANMDHDKIEAVLPLAFRISLQVITIPDELENSKVSNKKQVLFELELELTREDI